MEILYLLIPLAILIVAFIFGAYSWAVRNGQYDDMEGPAYRVLIEDDDHLVPEYKSKEAKPDTENQRDSE